MNDKNKIVIICGGLSTDKIHHIIGSMQSENTVIVVEDEKKQQLPFKEPIEFKITNRDLFEIEPSIAIPLKPVQDWSRNNYQQRNKKHKSKRK